MIRKFLTGPTNVDQSASHLELKVDVDEILLSSYSNIDDDDNHQEHYIQLKDIDDLITALADMKREIQELNRSNPNK